jgi:hypothetical protein
MRRNAAVLALLVSGVLAGVHPASATQDCVTITTTAPIVGTRTTTRCGPGFFTHPFFFRGCHSVPPAGVVVCVETTIQTP